MEPPREEIEPLSPISSLQRLHLPPGRRSPTPLPRDSLSPIDEIDPELRHLYNFATFNPSSRPSSLHSRDDAEAQNLSCDQRDSSESAVTPIAFHSNPSETSTLATPKPLDETKSLLNKSTTHPLPWTPKTTEIFLKSWVIWILFMTPVVFLVIWPSVALSKNVEFNLDSSPLGGKLSQAQAKGVDVFCSVIVAPLLVAGFDYAWFSAMRVVALNEKVLFKGASLRAITTAAGADSGSYNLVKTWTFLCSGRGVMHAFAVLLLFSAATKSLFANVIAYEAFKIPTELNLDSKLIGLANWSTVEASGFSTFASFASNSFTTEQRADYHSQFSSSFTSLGYENGSRRLTNKKYATADCTRSSRAAIPLDVRELLGVPGYQLSIDCKAETPAEDPRFLKGFDKSTKDLHIQLGNATSLDSLSDFVGYLRSLNGFLAEDGSHPVVLHKVGGPTNNSEVFIGVLYVLWNSQPAAILTKDTKYGPLEPRSANMSDVSSNWDRGAWGDPPSYLAVFGLRCGIFKETGLVTLQREANNNTWHATNFTSNSTKMASPPVALSIEATGDLGPGFQWPSLGDLVGRVEPCNDSCRVVDVGKLDLEQTKLNTLYAVGEADRIFYDVVAQVNGTELDYTVRGIQDVLWYRITYVPLLLLLALLSCAIAGSIPAILLLYNLYKASNAFWLWRATDPVRLLVDAVDGLREEGCVVTMHGQSNDVVEEWGKGYCVKFAKRIDEGNGVDIVLEPAGMKPPTDWLGAVKKVRRRKRSTSTSTHPDT